jgi:PPIC-type PPIASE domain
MDDPVSTRIEAGSSDSSSREKSMMFQPLRSRLARLPFLLVLATSGCSQSDARPAALENVPAEEATAAPEEPLPYPPGRWRLVSPQILANTALWVSHILILHEGSDASVPGVVGRPWRLDGPTPSRSRAEALRLANEIALQAAAQPQDFSRLARDYSEDSTTRSLGGALGGIRATDFMFVGSVLDALSMLKPGEISRVVETSHGFHVLQRRPVPAPGKVSGAHLVLAHDDASWLRSLGIAAPQRTRAEAMSLATSIQRRALAGEDFTALVRRHSEHPDREVGGDIGTWSPSEPAYYPRAVEALLQLPIGGISAPIDGHYGLEILQRTPDVAWRVYAMEAVKLGFDPTDGASKRAALDRARELIASLKRDPGRFDEWRSEYCCTGAERWEEGRDEPGLSRIVSQLALGQVVAEPVQQYFNVVVPRRVDPSAVPAGSEPIFELPAPNRPDLDWLLERMPPRLLVRELLALVAEQPAALKTDTDRERVLQELSRATAEPSASDPERWSHEEFTATFRQLLDADSSGQWRVMLERRMGDVILGGAARSVRVSGL